MLAGSPVRTTTSTLAVFPPARASPGQESLSSVPDGLVALVRSLWGTDVSHKGARRYIGALFAVGDPPATADEISRYLRWSANSSRVKRAKFPVAVACMPEEFADWLQRFRKLRVVTSTAPPSRPAAPAAGALSLAELGSRAAQLSAQLTVAPKREDPRADLDPPQAKGFAT